MEILKEILAVDAIIYKGKKDEMPKKFSQFISITIILFVFFLLLIIVGGIFLIHKEELKNEFTILNN
jgi:hypothetical protein